MKTLTEFNGFDLIPWIPKIQELVTNGKTPEEVELAIAEAKKLEGEKLKFFLRSIELIKLKAPGLKRVIVFTAQETDKIPSGAQKQEEHYYLAEYFPSAAGSHPRGDRNDRGKGRFGDKKGKRDGGRGRGGDSRPPRDGARPPRDDARPRTNNPLVISSANLAATHATPAAAGPERKRRQRPPRSFQPRPLLGPDGKPRPAPALPKPLDRPIGTVSAAPAVSEGAAPVTTESVSN